MSDQATLVKGTTPAPKRLALFSRVGVLLLIIGMVIAFFVSQLIGVYIAGRLLLPVAQTLTLGDIFYLGSNNGTVVSISLIVSLLLLSTLSVLVIQLRGGNSRQYLALKPFSLATGIGFLGLLLLFMIASQALTFLLDAEPSAFVAPLYSSVSSVWLLVVAIVIIAPLYEELVFRGILWSAIAEQFAGPNSKLSGAVIASIVTSVIFAVIHLQYGVYEISTIVLLALIFCYARFKSGSLLLPMLMHIINNGVAMWLYASQTL